MTTTGSTTGSGGGGTMDTRTIITSRSITLGPTRRDDGVTG